MSSHFPPSEESLTRCRCRPRRSGKHRRRPSDSSVGCGRTSAWTTSSPAPSSAAPRPSTRPRRWRHSAASRRVRTRPAWASTRWRRRRRPERRRWRRWPRRWRQDRWDQLCALSGGDVAPRRKPCRRRRLYGRTRRAPRRRPKGRFSQNIFQVLLSSGAPEDWRTEWRAANYANGCLRKQVGELAQTLTSLLGRS